MGKDGRVGMGKDGRVGMGKDGGVGMGRDGGIGLVRDEGERDRYGEGRNGGGREWCSLTWARHRPCLIMHASCHSQAVVSGAAIVVSVRGHSWALVWHSWVFMSSVHGRSSWRHGRQAVLGVMDGRDGGGWKTTIVCC